MRRRSVIAALAMAPFAASRVAAAPLASPLAVLKKTTPKRPITGLAMTTGKGEAVGLEAYRGRSVVLNLWASWCFPCRDELPSLSRLAAKAPASAVAVLPLAIERRGVEAVTTFYRESAISNLPVLLGDGPNIAAVFAEWGLPFTVLIDGEGNEIGRLTGPARWDEPAFVAWLLKQAGA